MQSSKEQQGEIRKLFSVMNVRNREKQQNGKDQKSFQENQTKGTFYPKMDTVKDRNGMDLTEAEDIRRGGKNTQKNCTKKIFMTQITMMV